MTDQDQPEFDSESENEDGYDSDDPESWGPYFWSNHREEEASLPSKSLDYLKLAGFKMFRNLSFAGEVMIHFFGLNKSEYQWVLDSVERERKMEEGEELVRRQQELLKNNRVIV